MKYAREVIDLMASYPGRQFRMCQIVNYVAPGATTKQTAVVKTGVWRVLMALEASGQVYIARSGINGSGADYVWKHQGVDQKISYRTVRRTV